MAGKKSVHVVPRDGNWAVKREGAGRASHVVGTQARAIEIGRSQAVRDRTELKIHDREGRIREGRSFGNDPYPPKG